MLISLDAEAKNFRAENIVFFTCFWYEVMERAQFLEMGFTPEPSGGFRPILDANLKKTTETKIKLDI